MKTTRVIQWATGPVGSVQLAEVIDNPEFELVGVFVYSPDKVGVDAGALVGHACEEIQQAKRVSGGWPVLGVTPALRAVP